ncbi:hypothetical protein BpHYR1_023700 [Brachionus plicatilis]
MNFIT